MKAAITLKEFSCRTVLVCGLFDFRLEKVKALGFSV